MDGPAVFRLKIICALNAEAFGFIKVWSHTLMFDKDEVHNTESIYRVVDVLEIKTVCHKPVFASAQQRKHMTDKA